MRKGNRHVFMDVDEFENCFYQFYRIKTPEARDFYIYADLEQEVEQMLEEYEAFAQSESYVDGEVLRYTIANWFGSQNLVKEYNIDILERAQEIASNIDKFLTSSSNLSLHSHMVYLMPPDVLSLVEKGLQGMRTLHKVVRIHIGGEVYKEPIYYAIVMLGKYSHSEVFADIENQSSAKIQAKLAKRVGEELAQETFLLYPDNVDY